MNTFNRLAMIILLLGTVLSIAVVILLLLLVPQGMGRVFANVGTMLLLPRGDPKLLELQLELTVVSLVVFVPAIVLLWLEIRRQTRDTIRISKISGSEAHLSTQAVAQSIIYYVDALQGVVRVRPRLAADANAISVRLDVETTPDIDVRAKTEEITRTTRNVVEEKLGLKLKRLNIHMHHSTFARNMQQKLPTPAPAPVALPSLINPPATDVKPAATSSDTKNLTTN